MLKQMKRVLALMLALTVFIGVSVIPASAADEEGTATDPIADPVSEDPVTEDPATEEPVSEDPASEDAPEADAVVTVDEVITMLSEMPTLKEMRGAMSSYSSGSSYSEYLETCFALRAQAEAAYNALSSDDQALVPQELSEKLSEVLTTTLSSNASRNIPAGENEYVFWLHDLVYEWSPHDNADGSNQVTFMLVDTTKYGGTYWTPDGKYIAGGSNNYEVAYCCDYDTSTDTQSLYRRVNLEDSGYYSDSAAQHIRSIVMNSYPFVSLESMKASLKGKLADSNGNVLSDEEVDKLTAAEIVAAVQHAIWYFSNEGSLSEADRIDIITYGNTWKIMTNRTYHDLTNDTWQWWNGSSNNYIEDAGVRMDALARYLVNMDGTAASPDTVVISNIEVVYMDADTSDESADTFPVEIHVAINGGGRDGDEVYITAVSESGAEDRVKVDGSRVYALNLNVKPGEEITVNVSGTQNLPVGVYFYQAQATATESARDASQNLVGAAMGETPINASATVTVRRGAEIGVKKTDESGKSLAGAEFTLYHVGASGTTELGTYKVTGTNGTLVISGLVPGKTYRLEETKAPNGYGKLDSAIEFAVQQPEGESEEVVIALINSSNDVSLDLNGVLTVINHPGGEISGDGDPLSPNTGDMSIIWPIMTGISGMGLALVSRAKFQRVGKRKKRK